MTGCAGTAPSISCPPLSQSTALRHLPAPLPLPSNSFLVWEWFWRGMMHIYPCSMTTVITQQGENNSLPIQSTHFLWNSLAKWISRPQPHKMTHGRSHTSSNGGMITNLPYRSMMLTEPSTGGLSKISRGSGHPHWYYLRDWGVEKKQKTKNASWENYDRVQTLSTSV